MPKKRRAKGYSANLLDPRYAQRLSSEDAEELSQRYDLSNPKELKDQFDQWAIIYRNNKQMHDDAPTPTVVRDTASAIANWAKKLAEELDGLDGRTRNAIETTYLDDSATPHVIRDFALLNQHGLTDINLTGDDKLPIRHIDLEPLASGVRLIEHNASRTVANIEAAEKRHGRKKPSLYASSFALVMLVNNVRIFWEDEVGPYTRQFDENCPMTDSNDGYPIKPASEFTVEIAQWIDPDISGHQVNRAMKEHIKTFGRSKPKIGQ